MTKIVDQARVELKALLDRQILREACPDHRKVMNAESVLATIRALFENRKTVPADIRKESVSDRFLADEEIESEFGATDESGLPY
jgi:hypothetical protein